MSRSFAELVRSEDESLVEIRIFEQLQSDFDKSFGHLYQMMLKFANTGKNVEDLESFVRTTNDMAAAFSHSVFLGNCCSHRVSVLEKKLEKSDLERVRSDFISKCYDDAILKIHVLMNQMAEAHDSAGGIVLRSLKEAEESKMAKFAEMNYLSTVVQELEQRNKKLNQEIKDYKRRLLMEELKTKYLSTEMAGRVQQIELLQNTKLDVEEKTRVWKQLDTEMNVQKLKTVVISNRVANTDKTEVVNDTGSRAVKMGGIRSVFISKTKQNQGLGIEIMGGVDRCLPIIISNKLKGSVADASKLRIGDTIVAVNDRSLESATCSEATKILQEEAKKEFIWFLVSYVHVGSEEDLQLFEDDLVLRESAAKEAVDDLKTAEIWNDTALNSLPSASSDTSTDSSSRSGSSSFASSDDVFLRFLRLSWAHEQPRSQFIVCKTADWTKRVWSRESCSTAGQRLSRLGATDVQQGTSEKKRLQSVDDVELSRHNKRSDCWIHIFGQVYDVTPYLEFHPGGVDELMRAAGRDGTPLFNQYHAWVNYESMLKSCLVGRFSGNLSNLKPCDPPTTTEDFVPTSSNFLSVGAIAQPPLNRSRFGAKIESFSNGVKLVSDEWMEIQQQNVVVSSGDSFRVLVRPFDKPPMEFIWKNAKKFLGGRYYRVAVISKGVEITFLSSEEPEQNEDLAKVLDDFSCDVQRRPGVSYHTCEIISKQRLTHDVFLYELDLPPATFFRIPCGHHVSVKVRKGGATLYRPYTPIMNDRCSAVGNDSEETHGPGSPSSKTHLFLKIYNDGICTPSLEALAVGDRLELSDPIGTRDFVGWMSDAQVAVFLAAGSGITPMVDLVQQRRKRQREINAQTFVVLFNKTEKDLFTRSEVDWTVPSWSTNVEEGFFVRDVLSVPSDRNDELYDVGRVHADLLIRLGIEKSSQASRKAFICGPDGFIVAAKEALEEVGFAPDSIHVFNG
ncbi:unnamed protein product [Caenorhabditis auriculariae]|uniref:Cytochrome-b5 reductase n=1 Tax=Caenorhabditis auriculariae TaxID=2777116 RepID=A0A8S1HI07_9PELO|nr:unnamed protein product [Caenorhabditis auriculariae]